MSTHSISAQESRKKRSPEAGLIMSSNAAGEVKPGYDPETFGAVLRGIKGRMTSDQFAIETGLSSSYICKAVSGHAKARPSRRTIIKLLSARTEAPFDRKELVRVAGYDEAELGALPAVEETKQAASLTASIRKFYGADPFAAMSELQRALSLNVLNGDVSSYYHREPDYFEIKDMQSGQVYAGINAYVRPVKVSGDEDRSAKDIDGNAVFPIAFAAGRTYNEIVKDDGARAKIVYILTDNERIYEGCRSVIKTNATRATVVVFTDDHQGFSKEMVLDGEGNDYVSLVE